MKRYLTTLIALVLITLGARAGTGYGFSVSGVPITSDNYKTANAGQPWWYDPSANVLHLTDGILTAHPTSTDIGAITVFNSSMTIQVDGNCTIKGTCYIGIRFYYGGTHTICGDGKLTITSDVNRATGIMSEEGTGLTVLTIKDLDLKISFNSINDCGLESGGFESITLDNCHITIDTSSGAWYGQSGDPNPILNDCHLLNGVFVDGGILENDSNGAAYLKNIEIRRLRHLDYQTVNVTIDSPEVGKALASTATVNNENIQVSEVKWYRVIGEYFRDLDEGYVAKSSETYKLLVSLKTIDTDYCDYHFAEDTQGCINGYVAGSNNYGSTFTIIYTFPELPVYYALWVGGKQVNSDNKDDVLEDGKVKYYPDMQILTLNGVNIKNSANGVLERTGYGCGIMTKMPSLTIVFAGDNVLESVNGNGIFFTDELTILGSTGDCSLDVKGKNGIWTEYGTKLQLTVSDNMVVRAEGVGTDGAGIGTYSGAESQLQMTVGSGVTLYAKGPAYSLGHLKSLQFGESWGIVEPVGSYFSSGYVKNSSGIIAGQWVTTGAKEPVEITTGIEAIDQIQNVSWYTIDGRKLNEKPTKKGVFVNNGHKVVVK